MSVSTSPFFSVIVPLYNKRDYILQAVESVLAQGYTDLELLVVDDGSTDGSAELLEAHVSDIRLRVIRQLNKGGAGGQARNTGMAEARGEWFAFLDADDLWLPNHLEELAIIALYVGRPALISTKPIEMPTGVIVKPDLRKESCISELNYFEAAGRQIGQNNCSSSAIHREVFERVGGFINVRSGPDLEYWSRVALEYPYALSDRTTSVYCRGNMGNMEQIASQNTDKPPPSLNKLADVSPSLAMLSDKATENPSLFEREDIRAYINGRLRSGMRNKIRQSLPRQARALRRLMFDPVDRQTQVLTIAAWLPTAVLQLLNAGYGLARSRRF
ncbi:glycosyltransferase family 2 protein [Hoeflea sp. WL0058]|uniref:Glycosyltransferase family 2 protein n=1 Tax=Flavimaribacter sediminis TaxID=2865987 RepID=A0AAE3CZX5_9HYPH|nr:glycosyltransferase family A protein [Flavimaribacter sediminis]MBW8636203.1 glycosyltransferase family 2 protein [Flavimaribacter sediminis]